MTDLAPAYQRRRLLVASALDVSVISIVQFMPEGKDVVSLIKALPAGLRSPALNALLKLLSVGQAWPTLRLDRYHEGNVIDRVCAAIALFPKVCIDGISSSDRWQGGDPGFKVTFCGFLK